MKRNTMIRGGGPEAGNAHRKTDYLFPYTLAMNPDGTRKRENGRDVHQVKDSFSHIPAELFNSADLGRLESFYHKNKDTLTADELAFLEARMNAETEIRSLEEQGRKALYHGAEPYRAEVTMDGRGYTGLDNMTLTGPQTSINGCWSEALTLMLRSRGVHMTQEQIRSFRPDFGDAVPTEDTNRWLNEDAPRSIIDSGDLIARVLPNTAVKSLTLDRYVAPEGLGEEEKAFSDEVRRQYRDLIVSKINSAFLDHQTPVALNLNGHYVTITGIHENGTLRYEDSARGVTDAPYQSTRFKTVDELLNQYIFTDKDVQGITLTWLEDIEAPEYEKKDREIKLPDTRGTASLDGGGNLQIKESDDASVLTEKPERERQMGRTKGRTVGVHTPLDRESLPEKLKGKDIQKFGIPYYLGTEETYLPSRVYRLHDPALMKGNDAVARAASEAFSALDAERNNVSEKWKRDYDAICDALNTLKQVNEKNAPTEGELRNARERVGKLPEFLSGKTDEGKTVYETLFHKPLTGGPFGDMTQLRELYELLGFAPEKKDSGYERAKRDGKKAVELADREREERTAKREAEEKRLRVPPRPVKSAPSGETGDFKSCKSLWRQVALSRNADRTERERCIALLVVGSQKYVELRPEERRTYRFDGEEMQKLARRLQESAAFRELMKDGVDKVFNAATRPEDLAEKIVVLHQKQEMTKAGVKALREAGKNPDALAAVEAQRAKTAELVRTGMATPEVLEEAVLNVFAIRASAGKMSPEAPRKEAAQQEVYAALKKGGAVKRFVEAQGAEEICRLMAAGRGEELEQSFRKHLTLREKEIPRDIPRRYMPTARERIERMQTLLGRDSLTPEQRHTACVELMACRLAVNGKSEKGLDTVLDAGKLEAARLGLEKSHGKAIDQLIAQQGSKLASLAKDGEKLAEAAENARRNPVSPEAQKSRSQSGPILS